MKTISNKKVMIFAPHQDDEINIAGGLISDLLANNVDVKVVYSTNGDFFVKADTRIRECKKALKAFGLHEDNIYFMGYSDQAREEDTHLYMTEKNDIWKSRKNIIKTYLPLGNKEVSMIYDNVHHEFNRNNFIKDIVSMIEKNRPDYVFCIDFDSHPDHRALSLSVECAVGQIINNDKDYRPIVFKSFAYPTFYFGYKDLDNINIKSTRFNTEKFSYCSMENPYYSWISRIRFPVSLKACNKFLLNNEVFKALNCHKSQCIVGKSFSTINGDQIFWQRRTDNLLNCSNLEVTSGDKEKLRDFMLYDCKNIMHGNTEKVRLECNAWIPDVEDKNPKITINFNEMKSIDKIKFYHSISSNSIISKVEVKADNKLKKMFTLKRSDDNVSEIELDNIRTKKLIIEVLDRGDIDAGFSEIEVLEKKDNTIKFIKTEIDGDFAYKYYYCNEQFQIYAYDGFESRYLSPDEYEIQNNNMKVEHNIFMLNNKKEKIRIVLKENPTIYDDVILIKKGNFSKIINKIINIINKIIVIVCYSKQKIVRKLKKIVKID